MSRSPTTPKFKIQMCQLYLSGKCTYAGLAETYNISKRTLREWVLKYNANCKCKLDTCTCNLRDKIDTAVKGNKKVKKVIVVSGVGVLFVCTIAIVEKMPVKSIEMFCFRLQVSCYNAAAKYVPLLRCTTLGCFRVLFVVV